MEKVRVKFDLKYSATEAVVLATMKDEMTDGDISGLLVYPDSFSLESKQFDEIFH